MKRIWVGLLSIAVLGWLTMSVISQPPEKGPPGQGQRGRGDQEKGGGRGDQEKGGRGDQEKAALPVVARVVADEVVPALNWDESFLLPCDKCSN
ncbi:MAG: hypothetical protein QM703_05795 [Gemmatales bacterium]